MLFSDNNFVGPWNIASNYGGWFHVYSFTMYLGMLTSVLFSWYRLHKRNLPVDGLIWSSALIIPASLLGGSFFGKLDPLNPIGFWQKFAFWKAGMSIHGGVLFGTIVGLIFFIFYRKSTKISLGVYGDCIIPNILLGQVIGRWGNFFNHELLGQIVGYSKELDASNISALSFLPAFIRDNCFKLVSGTPETAIINGTQMYVFRAPVFLYESLANLFFWIILTFVLPSVFRWFSKKPWKVEVSKYQILTFKDITKKHGSNWFKNLFLWIHKNRLLKKKYWNQAFYEYKPDSFAIKALNQNYQTKKEQALKKPFFKKFSLISQAYMIRSKKLLVLQNPKNYFVMRSGVQMWLYFFGWNLIRFCLELQRAPGELFIINNQVLDYVVLISLFSWGLILAILSHFIFAKYFRKSDWIFEKEY